MAHCGALWCTLAHFGALWRTLAHCFGPLFWRTVLTHYLAASRLLAASPRFAASALLTASRLLAASLASAEPRCPNYADFNRLQLLGSATSRHRLVHCSSRKHKGCTKQQKSGERRLVSDARQRVMAEQVEEQTVLAPKHFFLKPARLRSLRCGMQSGPSSRVDLADCGLQAEMKQNRAV